MPLFKSSEYQLIYFIMSVLIILGGLKLGSIAILNGSDIAPWNKVFYILVGVASIFLALNDGFFVYKKVEDIRDEDD